MSWIEQQVWQHARCDIKGKICVFSLQLLPQTSHPKNDIIINEHTSPLKALLFRF